jgi:hypothetical protein
MTRKPSTDPALTDSRIKEAQLRKLQKRQEKRSRAIVSLAEVDRRHEWIKELKSSLLTLNNFMTRSQLICNSPCDILSGKWTQYVSAITFTNRCLYATLQIRGQWLASHCYLLCKFESICLLPNTPSLAVLTIDRFNEIISDTDPALIAISLSLATEACKTTEAVWLCVLSEIVRRRRATSSRWSAPLAIAAGIAGFRRMQGKRMEAAELLKAFLKDACRKDTMATQLEVYLRAVRICQQAFRRFLRNRTNFRKSILIRWEVLEPGIVRKQLWASHKQMIKLELIRVNKLYNKAYAYSKIQHSEDEFRYLMTPTTRDAHVYFETMMRIHAVKRDLREKVVDLLVAAKRRVLNRLFEDHKAKLKVYEQKMAKYRELSDTLYMIGVDMTERQPKKPQRSALGNMMPTKLIEAVIALIHEKQLNSKALDLIENAINGRLLKTL